MREMKDSGVEWIGEIPKEWHLAETKFLFSIFSGATPKSELAENWDGEISWITPADYKTCDVYVSKGKRNLSNAGFQSCSTSLIPINSLIFSKRAPIGAVAINTCELCTNQGCLSCVNRDVANIDIKYFYYLMAIATEQYELFGSGTTFKEISSTNFAKFLLTYPPIVEQKSIAKFLDYKCAQIDALIANQQTQIEKLKAYKQSLITEVVTKGLDPDVPMKDSGVEWIGKIPNKWRISRIGLHYSIVLGKMLCPRQTDSTYTLEKYFCAANVHFGEICTDELKEMWFSPTEKKQYHIETGDMLIVEGGAGAGGCAIVQSSTSALAQNSIMIVRNSRGTDNRYLCYFIESLVKRGYIDIICNKATIPHFTKEKLSKTQFPVCSQEDQILISDYLDKKCSKINRLISLKQARIEKLEQYKKSLIYEYVTGKREVM